MLPNQQTSGVVVVGHAQQNVDAVEALIMSQENRPGIYRTIPPVSRETGIPRRKLRHNFIFSEYGIFHMLKVTNLFVQIWASTTLDWW